MTDVVDFEFEFDQDVVCDEDGDVVAMGISYSEAEEDFDMTDDESGEDSYRISSGSSEGMPSLPSPCSPATTGSCDSTLYEPDYDFEAEFMEVYNELSSEDDEMVSTSSDFIIASIERDPLDDERYGAIRKNPTWEDFPYSLPTELRRLTKYHRNGFFSQETVKAWATISGRCDIHSAVERLQRNNVRCRPNQGDLRLCLEQIRNVSGVILRTDSAEILAKIESDADSLSMSKTATGCAQTLYIELCANGVIREMRRKQRFTDGNVYAALLLTACRSVNDPLPIVRIAEAMGADQKMLYKAYNVLKKIQLEHCYSTCVPS